MQSEFLESIGNSCSYNGKGTGSGTVAVYHVIGCKARKPWLFFFFEMVILIPPPGWLLCVIFGTISFSVALTLQVCVSVFYK